MSTNQPIQPSSQTSGTLFPVSQATAPAPAAGAAAPAPPRLRQIERHQVMIHCASLDSLLPQDHRARLVWEYVEGLDLGRLYQKIQAVEGRAGRAAIDPRILLALWLYATL